jgi:hypothetical protein
MDWPPERACDIGLRNVRGVRGHMGSLSDSPPPHNPIGYQPTNNIQPIINAHETSSESVGSRQPSIHPGYWSPIGSQAKASTSLTGYEPVGQVIW